MPELVERLQASLPSRYTVQRVLGRGGMATVYLATEQHPSREVAIKVFDPDLTQRVGRERFLREVDFASKLTHPHIVPVYAAGDAGGLLYYVMPYVAGESLRERLTREGQLPVEDALRIAHDVADVLDYAHQRNVIHRDIKPENILLHGGHAFVTDFGIARAIDVATDDPLTGAGVTLGTPAYMSPEQATASGQLDGRSDLYGLACVLYEMLAGTPPFAGRTAQVILARHAVDPVPPLRTARRTVPTLLDNTIQRALAKAPADRYGSAREFRDALGAAWGDTGALTPPGVARNSDGARAAPKTSRRRLAAAGIGLVVLVSATWFLASRGVTPSRASTPGFTASVAVMPFANLTGDSTYDHVAAGITDEIISQLARIQRLKVISRNSVLALQHARLTTPEIAETLGVRHLLEGSVRRHGPRLVVTAQLIEASSDAHLWTDSYERDVGDEFGLQTEVGRRAMAAVIGAIGNLTAPAIAQPQRDPSPGHDAFLVGRHWLSRRTPDGMRRAVAAFTQAVTTDSTFAEAWAGLSSAYALSVAYRYESGLNAYTAAGRALAAAERAIALDSNLAGAYAARAYVASRSQAPPDEVAADFQRALELQPSAADAPSWYAYVLAEAGDAERALAEGRRSIELDPLSASRRIAHAYEGLRLRRFDIAVEEARKAASIEPELMLPRAIEARALLLSGRAAECLGMALGPHAGIRATCLAAAGEAQAGRTIADSLSRAFQGAGFHDSVYTAALRAEDLAGYYAWTGDAAQSASWVARAYALSPSGVEVRVLQSPLFDKVRDTPIFAREMERSLASVWTRVMHERDHYLSGPAGS